MADYYIQTVLDGRHLSFEYLPPSRPPESKIVAGKKKAKFYIKQNEDGTYTVDATLNLSGRLISYGPGTQNWDIRFRPTHDAFTIEEVNLSYTWTTPVEGADPQILVQAFSGGSEPDLPKNVLFKLVPA